MRNQEDVFIPAHLGIDKRDGKYLVYVCNEQHLDHNEYMNRPDIKALYAEAERLTRKINA